MKKFKIFILVILILIGLTGCIKKIETKETVRLYPAFEIQNNKPIWGYINQKGEFEIEPKYAETLDFSVEGLAKVKSGNGFGVIDTKGNEILTPKYQFVSDFENGYFYAFDGEYSYVYNYKGEEQFFTDEFLYIGPYSDSDSLFTVAKVGEGGQPVFGYLNKSGKTVIEAKFSEAWDFVNGQALVKYNDKYTFIGTDGKVLMELPYELMARVNNMDLYVFKEEDKLGIVNNNGDLKVEPKFTNMNPEFDNDIIIVNEGENFGLIDINGNEILEMKYEDIKPLGEGYFAVKEKGKYALLRGKGEVKLTTDFIYDNIGSNINKIKSDLVGVYDGEHSYLIDLLSSDKSSKGPTMSGPADIYYDGYVSRYISNNKVSYYNSKGELIWEEKNLYQLNDTATVNEDTYTNDEGLNIKYPVIEGLKDKSIEDSINERLYKEFVEDVKLEDHREYLYYNINYTVSKSNDLLTITKASNYLTNDDLYPASKLKIYHINLNKGTFHEFKDLFKKESDYVRIISDMIRGQMEQKNSQGMGMYDLSDWKEIGDNINFIVNIKNIDIYFNPEDIISFTEQFPKFSISQQEIEDILDFSSEFWWAFMVSRGF